MWFICLLLSLLSSCYCGSVPDRGALENNTIWLTNENLVIQLDKIYDNLPSSIIKENAMVHKRAFSVIAELALLYTALNHTSPLGTVKMFDKTLPQPSDVISADPRKDLDALRAVIDQPINDIKRACKPETTSMECVNLLHYHVQQQTDKCKKYENHVKLRNVIDELARSPNFYNFLTEAVEFSLENPSDILAVAFFVHKVNQNELLFTQLRKVYQDALAVNYPCIRPGPYDS